MAVLEQAVSAYGGDLLAGFYEYWIGPERDRLAASHVNALCLLAECREESGDVAGAIEAAQRAVAADPLQETSHPQLMRLHLSAGEPAHAVRQLRRILRRELGQSPSPGTRAVAEAIRAHLRQPSAPDVAPPPAAPPAADAIARQKAVAAPRLPVPLTRFFGRTAEIQKLAQMLEDPVRLVTLTGPGDAGKTRLALEAAGRLQDAFRGGVWFVPLAERSPSCPVIEAVCNALRLRRTASDQPADQAISALRHAPALLVLDNFEHLVEQGAPTVHNLLERLPDLRVLVTSQVRLQVSGEREMPVPPLDVPNGAVTAEALTKVPSFGLFIDRAQGVRPDFQINERSAGAVADICRRLDGLPLAIELAAAWAHTLTPAQMLDRLPGRFDLLVSRGRDVFSRHRALRTTLEWSYGLLPGDLQRAFAQLSVFRNGWTLDAAQEVLRDPLTLGHVAALREMSLLSARDDGTEMRFFMLEALQ